MQRETTIRALAILTGLGFIALDQWVKVLALASLHTQSFHYGTAVAGLEVALSLNPGAFLSLGAGLAPQLKQLIFVGAVGAVVCWALWWALANISVSRSKAAAVYGIALGGASNLLDRLFRQGHVVDYLIANLGPLHTGVFNLADVSITLGALALMLGMLREPHTPTVTSQE